MMSFISMLMGLLCVLCIFAVPVLAIIFVVLWILKKKKLWVGLSTVLCFWGIIIFALIGSQADLQSMTPEEREAYYEELEQKEEQKKAEKTVKKEEAKEKKAEPVNYSKLCDELQSIIDTQIEPEDTYTPNSYKNYSSALSEAKKVKNNSNSTEEELQTAKSNLEAALSNLSVKPDKTELIQKLETARQIDKTLYLSSSTVAFIKALDESSKICEDDNASTEDVQKAINNLDTGIQALIVKSDKTELSKLLSQANALDKNKYTTVSADQLTNVITTVTETANNEEATQEQVNTAHQTLKAALDSMVKATKGVYTLSCSLRCVSNNHVGNDWSNQITYNGTAVRNGDTITASLNGRITIKGMAVENDSIPDRGSGSVTISLAGGEKSTQFSVRENRGRYSGNLAIWELTCSVTLIERI